MLQCIDYDFKGLQDPTYYVLLAYVQHTDATIDKILRTLQRIHRLDIINQIKDNITDLIDKITQRTTTDGIITFMYHKSNNYVFNLVYKNISICVESALLRPRSIPKAPLVLTPINFVHNIRKHKAVSDRVIQDNLKKVL